MFLGKLFERLEDVILDHSGIFFGVGGVVRHNSGGEIGAVDRVVNGDGDLKGFSADKDCAGDTSPHRLDKQMKMTLSAAR